MTFVPFSKDVLRKKSVTHKKGNVCDSTVTQTVTCQPPLGRFANRSCAEPHSHSDHYFYPYYCRHVFTFWGCWSFAGEIECGGVVDGGPLAFHREYQVQRRKLTDERGSLGVVI